MPKLTGTSASAKIPRPMNCFLAFRLAKQNEILSLYPGANHRDISKVLAKLWKEIPEDEKKPYREQARLAKIEHSRLYPDYRYRPKKKGERQRRRYTRRTGSRSLSSSSMEKSNQLMDILFKDSRRHFSEPSPCTSWSSMTSCIGGKSCSSNSCSRRSESPPLSDCLVNFFPPPSYSPDLSSSTASPFVPGDRSPPSEYFYCQSQGNVRQQQLEIEQQPNLGHYQHPPTVVLGSFFMQPATAQDMPPSMISTYLIMPLDDIRKSQVAFTTEYDYLNSSYPPCYYTCPPNL